MLESIPWILISILVLLIILLILFFVNKKKRKRKFSKLTWIAFIFVILGITISDNKLIAYSLMGIGIIFAIIDIIIKSKKK